MLFVMMEIMKGLYVRSNLIRTGCLKIFCKWRFHAIAAKIVIGNRPSSAMIRNGDPRKDLNAKNQTANDLLVRN